MTGSAAVQPVSHRIRALRLLGELVVLVAAALLIFTGFVKLLDEESFALTIAAHGLVPEPVVGQIASVVVIGEIVLGVVAVALMAAWGRLSVAAGLLAGVAGMFGWYAFFMVLFPPPEPVGCGCGFTGSDAPADWPMIAARNAAAAVVFALISLASRQAPEARSAH